MKDSKLEKGLIASALGATMLLTGCNTNNMTDKINTNGNNLGNESSVGMVSNNADALTTQDLDMPVTAEIEKVQLENFETGYKLPAGYLPYNVDSEYNFPAMLGIAEKTEDYTIFSLPIEKDEYGNDVEVSFDGAIGVYEPYFRILGYKDEILNKYAKEVYSDDYSFATEEEQQLLNAIDILNKNINEAYSASKNAGIKK